MAESNKPGVDEQSPAIYRVRLKGHLGREWMEWFEGMAVTLEDGGDTLLTGQVADQAALHGLFKKMRDLGLPLVSVNRYETGREDGPDINPESGREKMNPNEKSIEFEDRKVVFQAVWIFTMLNYIYCDIISQMDAEVISKILSGELMPFPTTQGFWLGMSVLMEVPIAMVLLSRVLKYPANRWANIFAGAFLTLVQLGSLTVGTGPTLSYLFFSVLEIGSTLFIVWYALTWTRQQVKAAVPAQVGRV